MHADDSGVGPEEHAQLRREFGQAMRLDGEEDDVHGADGIERIDHAGPRFELAIRADHANAALLHGVAVRGRAQKV